jgi:hypothetical protein
VLKRTVFLIGVLILALVVGAVPASAQVGAAPSSTTLGVIAGLNMTMPKFDPDIDDALDFIFDDSFSEGKKGFLAGITFDMNLTPKMGFRAQGTIVQNGVDFGGSATVLLPSPSSATPAGASASFTDTIKVRLTQLEIGAMAVLPVGAAARINILAGLFFAFGISDSIEEEFCEGDDCETVELENGPDGDFDINTNNTSLGFGAEFKATEKLFIGILYKFGLTNIDNLSDQEDPLFNSVKVNAFQVFVRIRFGS